MMNSKELEELDIILTYEKERNFSDKVAKRLDRCRKKLNATKPRIYESEADRKDDEKWIEDFKKNVEAKMQRQRAIEMVKAKKNWKGLKLLGRQWL